MNTCEDYPCCGHELGDCDGTLYGDVRNDPHLFCDHNTGLCDALDDDDDLEDTDD